MLYWGGGEIGDGDNDSGGGIRGDDV